MAGKVAIEGRRARTADVTWRIAAARPSLLAFDANKLLAYKANIKATLLIDDKLVGADGAIVAVKVWQVPSPVPPSQHDLKYRLVYIVNGVRVIGFDNERGKGDHCHIDGVETVYAFKGIRPLLADFEAAITNWRSRHGRS